MGTGALASATDFDTNGQDDTMNLTFTGGLTATVREFNFANDGNPFDDVFDTNVNDITTVMGGTAQDGSPLTTGYSGPYFNNTGEMDLVPLRKETHNYSHLVRTLAPSLLTSEI